MTDVAKPVASVAATKAHLLVAAVMSTLAILIGNASAYVSSISTPLISIKIPSSAFGISLHCAYNLKVVTLVFS